jgi:hypothetical protein
MLERDPKFHSEIIISDVISRPKLLWSCSALRRRRCDKHDAETKQQFQRKSPSCPCPRKAEQVCSSVKSKLTGFVTFTGTFVMNLFCKYKL